MCSTNARFSLFLPPKFSKSPPVFPSQIYLFFTRKNSFPVQFSNLSLLFPASHFSYPSPSRFPAQEMGKQTKSKTTQSFGKGKVTPMQVAFIVDRYLSDNNFSETGAVFRTEASSLLSKSPVQEVVTVIALPSGSDKLYTGSNDETVRVWDCQSGQCMDVIQLGGEVGCMISEGPWIFVGIPNVVKAWNTQTNTDLTLNGPVGQVYALVVGNGLLFAGTQDGAILAWKFNPTTFNFEPAASLTGHNVAVVSLVVGANRLYSGSMDHSIRVWNLDTLQGVQTLSEHTSVVISVLCWDQFLLSCSLDQTVKVWAATESGNLEVTYTHNEEHVPNIAEPVFIVPSY